MRREGAGAERPAAHARHSLEPSIGEALCRELRLAESFFRCSLCRYFGADIALRIGKTVFTSYCDPTAFWHLSHSWQKLEKMVSFAA